MNTKPFLFFVVTALSLKLKENLALSKAPQVSTTQQLRALVMNPESDLSYPMGYLKYGSFDINEMGIRANRLSQGVLTNYTAEGHDATRLNLVPIALDLTFGFIGEDTEQILDFVQRWTFASIKFRCNFTLSYMGIDLDNNVELKMPLSVPDREDSITIDRPDFHELQAEMTLRGIIDNQDPRDRQEVPLIKTPVGNVAIVKEV